MAYVKKTNLRGPQGPAGPQASTEQIFDKAWPIGTVLETNSDGSAVTINGKGERITLPASAGRPWPGRTGGLSSACGI